MRRNLAFAGGRPKPAATFTCLAFLLAAAALFWTGLYWVIARWFG
ncbi:hypothetical protein [Caulobacter sp. CCUG 60055]|nr:hypothetical protein [Caulobacter sp. CCUG 60055]